MARLEFDLTVPMHATELEAAGDVQAGSPLAVVGPSGAGKSTLLRALAGLSRPTRGRVMLGAAPLYDHAAGIDVPVEQRGFGLVFQQLFLFPERSVRANVAFGARGDRALVDDLLARLRIEHLAAQRADRISGGERQRVALARALAATPRALLLDEPLSQLDVALRRELLIDLGVALRAFDGPAIVVTHSFEEAALLADELLVLVEGCTVQRGTPTMLIANPRHPFVAELAGSNVLRGTARHDAARGITRVELDPEHGGGVIWSADRADGRVSALVDPADITVGSTAADSSALNRLQGPLLGAIPLQGRMRLQVAGICSVDITHDSWDRLGLVPGSTIALSFKATSVRLVGSVESTGAESRC